MIKFPDNFLWGTATSSHQIEGAATQGGRAWSIWDAHAHTPGRTHNNENADIACDHYNRYKEDVKLMGDLGLKAYRFSISWSRIQPDGQGKPNPEGIHFYNNLIDELLKYGITPWITLYHWDLPLALHTEKDGWLNPDIADYFEAYAELCFSNFGDRVKHWITLNEPWVVSILGYAEGVFAPGRKSREEPYIVAHNLLRAHGKAVANYRTKYQPSQKGVIGITNNCDWREPLTDEASDVEAAQRSLEFFLGWFADPIYFGDYPAVMRERVGDRLPEFSEEDRELIKGSSDFFGLNHYTGLYASDVPPGEEVQNAVYGNGGIFEDQYVQLTAGPEWKLTTMNWAILPWGCKKLLEWISERYDNPPIYITENGCALDDKPEDGKVHDPVRKDYLQSYLTACHQAMEQGVDLKGYFVWSFMDNFEWALGYSKRFGITYVDYETLERIPKESALWFKDVISNNGFEPDK
ncbi:GH1 family beta-glucosidase [Poritiphilus flavus]|uniref:Beta-glucosidase n=1 Tax=Poritiphilus flavus TaxID=2697053 RepID=A0A6L9EC66_9FLAO|nr:GH1 family beta-glucosidase [Poritiphilus flavus]NAS12330.1 beta-glucosidase [Poritiphilus flavus]